MSEIASRLDYWLAAALFLIGLYGMVDRPNLVRKLMAMNILQVSVIQFFILLAVKTGATPPISVHGDLTPTAADYINPLPHTLMLTAIVVSVSTTGVALALLVRIKQLYGTLNENELHEQLRK